MINTVLSIALLLLIQHVDENPYTNQRLKMVRYQIENRGLNDHATLEAMRKVKRHLFVINIILYSPDFHLPSRPDAIGHIHCPENEQHVSHVLSYVIASLY